jgi:1-acyl-sn-glycerol-3-phosphate acyltransferase
VGSATLRTDSPVAPQSSAPVPLLDADLDGPDQVADIGPFVPPLDSSEPLDDDVLESQRDDTEFPSPVHESPAAQGSAAGRVHDVAREMRAVEEEVDRILSAQREQSFARRRRDDEGIVRGVVEKLKEVLPVQLPGEDGTLVDAAKDILSTDYYLRQWGRIGLRNRSEDVDEFGLDPVYEARFRTLIDLVYQHYFRVEVKGVENVPDDGRCILVANHSGVLSFDGIMVRAAVRREHPRAREVRWLAEDFIFHLPFVGAFMNRIGAVRACQENAERLLKRETAVLVFPEGIKGIGKLYRDRYKLQRFGRGGFVKLAMRTRSPIVPVSILGAEESAPMLYRLEYLTEALGLPYVPVTPTFPLLGPFGLLPAPTKWRIEFGAPIYLDEHGAEAADDALLVNRVADRVRGQIQTMVDGQVKARKSIWFG